MSNTLQILGYMEKHEICRHDSFQAFDEICSIAEQMKVDLSFRGGDLFRENKPSRSTLVKAFEILPRHCLNDHSVQFQSISDQTVNFQNTHHMLYNGLDLKVKRAVNGASSKQVKTNPKNAINEHFLPCFLDFIVWGLEHENLVDPLEVQGMRFHIMQPGSSVATSLIDENQCQSMCFL